MLDMALNAVRFFRNESCGKCVPCRNGSQKMIDILTGWTQGKGTAADMDSARRAVGSHEARLDLRPGPVRALADHVGDQTFPAGSGSAHSGASLSGGRLPDARRARMSDLHLTIDGQAVTVPSGTTVFDAARLHGIAIPTLCHQQNETPVGVCRVCVVEAGGRVLSASCVRPAEEGMTVATNSDKVRERAPHAARAVDGRSSVSLRSSEPVGRLRAGNAGSPGRPQRVAIFQAPVAARPGRFVAGHRGGSRSLHPLRPLHSRLRRDSQQLRAGPARQGFQRRDRVRSEPAHGQLGLRFLRRMHGLLPHRRADQQVRGADGTRRRAGRGRGSAEASLLPESLRHVPGAEPERGGEAHVFTPAISSAAKASTDPPRSTFWKARPRYFFRRRSRT